MRVAIYARVSTPDRDQDPETQLIPLREFTIAQQWETHREFVDHAPATDMAHRTDWRNLLGDASKRRFDLVVVHTLDRWARNLKVLLESVSLLDQHNVGLVSITEKLDWSTPEGRLVARILGSFGEFFSDMLATHVKKGIDERARQGKHLACMIHWSLRNCSRPFNSPSEETLDDAGWRVCGVQGGAVGGSHQAEAGHQAAV